MIEAILSLLTIVLLSRLFDRESTRERRDKRYLKLAVFIVNHRMKREQRKQRKQSKITAN